MPKFYITLHAGGSDWEVADPSYTYLVEFKDVTEANNWWKEVNSEIDDANIVLHTTAPVMSADDAKKDIIERFGAKERSLGVLQEWLDELNQQV